jgi:hypothetical protein
VTSYKDKDRQIGACFVGLTILGKLGHPNKKKKKAFIFAGKTLILKDLKCSFTYFNF